MTVIGVIQDIPLLDKDPLWRVFWGENGEELAMPFPTVDIALEFANGKAKRLAGGNGAAVGVA